MRFECDSCHAKYKISDEKVVGRVVRFPCRKCEYKILIDGRRHDADVTVPAGAAYGFDDVTSRSEPPSPFSPHEAATARARRPSAPARRRPPSVPPRRPAAAARRLSSVPAAAAATGAALGHNPGLAPPLPAPVAPVPLGAGADVPEWHVSINDVSVGPIRLEEMAHKIDAGAVSEYSLVWREGFEEWRPLGAVPALVSLLHERRHSGPPPRSSFSSMPAFVDMAEKESASSASPDSLAASEEDEIGPLADALQPEDDIGDPFGPVSQPPAPIGPEEVFGSSPQLGSFSGFPPSEDDEVSVPSAPPAAAAATAEPRRGPSLGVLALIIAVAVFSGVVAFLAFERFGDDLLDRWVRTPETNAPPARSATLPATSAPAQSDEPTAATEATAPEPSQEEDGEGFVGDSEATQPEQNPAAVGDSPEPEQEAAPETAKLVPPPDPSDDRPAIKPAPRPQARARRTRSPRPAAAAPTRTVEPSDEPETDLSAAEQKILDEFGSSANAAPAKIDVKDAPGNESANPPLDDDAIRSTVTANKPKLQRCYERAIRGQQSPPLVRLDVTVRVAASGRVKEVSSQGDGPGGLAACVEASVRRWRFPASAEGGPAKFPIVFSSN